MPGETRIPVTRLFICVFDTPQTRYLLSYPTKGGWPHGKRALAVLSEKFFAKNLVKAIRVCNSRHAWRASHTRHTFTPVTRLFQSPLNQIPPRSSDERRMASR